MQAMKRAAQIAADRSEAPLPGGKLSATSESFHHYLPIPDSLFHSGIYVTSAGLGIVHPGEEYPPAQHPSLYHFTWNDGRTLPEFSLLMVSDGCGIFESREAGRLPVEAGTVILIFPGVWHRYRP